VAAFVAARLRGVAIPAKLNGSGVLGPFLGLVARLVARRVVYDGLGEGVEIARSLA